MRKVANAIAPLTQEQIKKQLHINPKTAIDWDISCRETCEVTIQRNGKEFKFMRAWLENGSTTDRGHRVKGQ